MVYQKRKPHIDRWFCCFLHILGQEIHSFDSKNGRHKLTATLHDYTKDDKSLVISAVCRVLSAECSVLSSECSVLSAEC